MKNVIITVLTVCATALTGISTVNAQTKNSVGKPEFGSGIIEAKITEPVFLADLREINPKTMRDFAKKYKNAEAVSWTKIKGGVVAQFFLDEIGYAIYYTANGNWSGSIKGYYEKKMPYEIKDLVKRKYHDYSIYFVEEMETTDSEGSPTYLIHLHNRDNVKLIRVFDKEMELWKEYRKCKS